MSRFLEHQVANKQSDAINQICFFLESEIIPNTGNYFDELIEIAKICKPMYAYAWYYKVFVEKLKAKILEERGEEDGSILIAKFSKG